MSPWIVCTPAASEGHRKRGRDDAVPETDESMCDPGTDSMRGAGDDRHVPRLARSSDEVRLVDHAAGATAADADEDAFVQPGELAGRGLDLRGGSKGVLAGIDILAAAETFENLRAAVAYASRLHVEQWN